MSYVVVQEPRVVCADRIVLSGRAHWFLHQQVAVRFVVCSLPPIRRRRRRRRRKWPRVWRRRRQRPTTRTFMFGNISDCDRWRTVEALWQCRWVKCRKTFCLANKKCALFVKLTLSKSIHCFIYSYLKRLCSVYMQRDAAKESTPNWSTFFQEDIVNRNLYKYVSGLCRTTHPRVVDRCA